ncbi:hypothetical protein WEB32_32655 [Streptomyces netropsis]|uniref:DUF3291 domain-containing protein n=1 Tax=Streptomyces netropsis TaxID=55404 RepID=A0A7W7PEB8_STRNE|nr:hypothetical protein [Streptomyces netropsis]MBB4885500.1 hypothetical protein [Streptomyces netropsis]GGR38603.1 hypothetical protein GCM10010219_49660 [Streptomyces netropsis]
MPTLRWTPPKHPRPQGRALGASLIAQPLKGVFWTLSAWEDRATLYGYAKAEPIAAS